MKTAVHNKKLRVTSERQMKQGRNEAVAEVGATHKDVRRPRGRSGGAKTATAVIPVELTISHAYTLELLILVESNQIRVTEQMQQWYASW